MTPRIKAWLALGGLAAAVASAALCLLLTEGGKEKVKNDPPVRVHIAPERLSENHFTASFGAKLEAMNKELEALKKNAGKKAPLEERPTKPAANPFEAVPGTPLYEKKTEKAPSIPIRRLARATIPPKTQQPNVRKQPPDAPIAQNRSMRRKAFDMIPSGSFIRGRLLNGVDAPTGGQANGNPVPLLIELTDKAAFPNSFKSDLRRCFVTANATGDLSSERVLIRLDRLSCVDDAGGVVDVKLTGYVSGSDGRTGVRARVVTRSGQAIANAITVGLLSGLGEAVSLDAQEYRTNVFGTNSNTVRDPWKAGLGKGAQDAFSRIADYYLKLADKIFPVLEIDAGKAVDIVITQSVSITRETL